MFLHDGVARRQAETVAVLLRGEVGIEDAVGVLERDAAALVADTDANVAAIANGQRTALRLVDISGRDTNEAAVGHGLHGVQREVLEDLADLPRIDFGGPQPRLDVDLSTHVGAAQHELHRVADDTLHGRRTAHRRPALGKCQELPGQALGA